MSETSYQKTETEKKKERKKSENGNRNRREKNVRLIMYLTNKRRLILMGNCGCASSELYVKKCTQMVTPAYVGCKIPTLHSIEIVKTYRAG